MFTLYDIHDSIAINNYPYETISLSAKPVDLFCSNIMINISQDDSVSLLSSISKGINVLSSNYDCKIIKSNIDLIAWNYQTSTQFVFPMCSNGETDMFEPQNWIYENYKKNCYSKYN